MKRCLSAAASDISFAARAFSPATVEGEGDGLLARIHQALDVRHGDRVLDHAPVGIEDGIARILPALVLEPLLRSGLVGIEALRVGVSLHPGERPQQLVLQGPERIEVAGMGEVGRRGDEEQAGRRVVAVIVQERCQAELGERPALTLVQNLARLGVEMIVGRGCVPPADGLE